MECAAVLDILIAMGACPPEPVDDAKTLLVRIVSMLSKMTENSAVGVREEEAEYGNDR